MPSAPSAFRRRAVLATIAFALFASIATVPRAFAQDDVDEFDEDLPAVAEIPKVRKSAVPAKADEIPGLIADLGHADARQREAASDRLAASGPAAVESLRKAAQAGPLESRVRAVAALRRVLQEGGDDAAIDAADAALEELSSAGGASVASRAGLALSDNLPARERRALRTIRSLGGIVSYGENPFGDAEGEAQRVVTHIVIGKDWKGGDDGLRHFQRLPRLPILYYIAESGVTDEGLKRLQTLSPQLQVQRRARSCLGVAGGNAFNGRGCYVQRVVPDSAADRAGIEVNDTIVSFDGRPVGDFNELIELIGSTKPGDKIKIQVQRDARTLNFEAVMAEWTK